MHDPSPPTLKDRLLGGEVIAEANLAFSSHFDQVSFSLVHLSLLPFNIILNIFENVTSTQNCDALGFFYV
jgi:hypothetical protein